MILFFELIIFWLFISANFHLFILVLGFFGIIGSYLICAKFFQKINEINGISHNLDSKISPFKALKFGFFSLIDIFSSSFFLIKKSLKKEDPIDLIYEINLDFLKNDCEVNLLTHYITSTPGSITIQQIDERKFLVHTLYEENLDDLKEISNSKIIKFIN
jgi:multisubunit Na+/H+ antiporter MnhE subunit